MRNLLPAFVAAAFFILSFWGARWTHTAVGIVLSSGAMVFFLILAFVDPDRMYHHLFFAVLGAGLAWKGLRSSQRLRKSMLR